LTNFRPALPALDYTHWKLTMNRINRLGFVGAIALFGFCLYSGCNQGASNDTSTTGANAADPSTEAVAKAAADFLDAVLKGDTQRASARLTPQAMQRIIASGKQFAPPGLETATFRIGEVRAPSVDKAFVHCVLTDTAAGDSPHSEEMCCLMRLVDNDWRVSGIAYWSGPNQAGTMSDFETGQSTPIQQRPSTPNSPGPSMDTPPGGRPSPPRMAQEPATAPR
jgi:hypothetical protein